MMKTLGTTEKHDSFLLNWPQLLFEAIFVPLFSGCCTLHDYFSVK